MSITQLYCFDCNQPLPTNVTWRTSICASCKDIRRAKWHEEHSRVAADGTVRKDKGWMIGDACQVKLGKITYQAKIIDMSDVSRRESDHDLMKLEISKTVTGLDGKPYTHTWTHPEPVQSYKLRKPLLKDEVSA